MYLCNHMGYLTVFFTYHGCMFMSLTRCPHYNFNNYVILHFMNLSLFNQFPTDGQVLSNILLFIIYYIKNCTAHPVCMF